MAPIILREQIDQIRAEVRALRERAEQLESLLPGLEYMAWTSGGRLPDPQLLPSGRVFAAKKREAEKAVPRKKRSKIAGAKVKRLMLAGKTRRIVELMIEARKPQNIKTLAKLLRDSSENSVRSMVYQLINRRLVASPARGYYVVTPAAIELLQKTAPAPSVKPSPKAAKPALPKKAKAAPRKAKKKSGRPARKASSIVAS